MAPVILALQEGAALTDGKWPLDLVLVPISFMAIGREWQVQGVAIRSATTSTRPTAADGPLETLAAEPTLASVRQRPFALVFWAAVVQRARSAHLRTPDLSFRVLLTYSALTPSSTIRASSDDWYSDPAGQSILSCDGHNLCLTRVGGP